MRFRPIYEHQHQYIETERFNEFMTQVYDALSAEIQAAVDEISVLVADVAAQVQGTPDTQLQILVDKLTASVNAAKAATTPVTPVVPVVAVP